MSGKKRLIASGPEQALQQLRRFIGTAFGVDPTHQLLFAPSILVSLKLLFAIMGIQRLLLACDEYYTGKHFFREDVRACALDSLLPHCLEFQPDAIIVSLVSWSGVVSDVKQIFSEIRRRVNPVPLLIGDFSHAGAIGFPSFNEYGADVICGDLAKWVLPLTRDPGIAFLHFRDEGLFTEITPHFAPFYLSGASSEIERLSRWIDPGKVVNAAKTIAARRIGRREILRQYRTNRKMAERLAEELNLAHPLSCILWLPREKFRFTGASRHELVWQTDSGTRVLCRADASPALPSWLLRHSRT
jgi:hypothetical protein